MKHMQTRKTLNDLALPWRDLWDGDLAIADRIIAHNFVAHAAPLSGTGSDTITGIPALKGWIEGIHAVVGDLRFTIELGPFIDGDYLVVRWRARGRYKGGFPGAKAAIGTPVNFTGTDTLRVESGRLAEYWANADSLLFVQQLEIG